MKPKKKDLNQLIFEENILLTATALSKCLCQEKKQKHSTSTERRIGDIILTQLVQKQILCTRPNKGENDYAEWTNISRQAAAFVYRVLVLSDTGLSDESESSVSSSSTCSEEDSCSEVECPLSVTTDYEEEYGEEMDDTFSIGSEMLHSIMKDVTHERGPLVRFRGKKSH